MVAIGVPLGLCGSNIYEFILVDMPGTEPYILDYSIQYCIMGQPVDSKMDQGLTPI